MRAAPFAASTIAVHKNKIVCAGSNHVPFQVTGIDEVLLTSSEEYPERKSSKVKNPILEEHETALLSNRRQDHILVDSAMDSSHVVIQLNLLKFKYIFINIEITINAIMPPPHCSA